MVKRLPFWIKATLAAIGVLCVLYMAGVIR